MRILAAAIVIARDGRLVPPHQLPTEGESP